MTFSCFCFLVLMSWYTYYPMVHLHIIQLSGKYMYNRKLTGIEKKNMYNRVFYTFWWSGFEKWIRLQSGESRNRHQVSPLRLSFPSM